MKITQLTKLKINPELISKNYENKVYILEPEKGVLRTLNPTASFIWKKLHKETIYKDLVNMIHENYKCTFKRADKDTRKFLDLYLRKKFIIASNK